jgi:hypothetical protein
VCSTRSFVPTLDFDFDAFPKRYKQQKYNLAREETEGYSKLLAELLANTGPPHDPATGRPVEGWAANIMYLDFLG